MKKHYPIAADSFDDEEIAAAVAVLKSGRYTMGEKVLEFERVFAQWVGAPHSVMVNSGSSANLLAIDALLRRSDPTKIWCRPGDEVLVPALSWSTTVAPLIQLGLVPVFVDVDPQTLAMDLRAATAAATSKTKAVVLVHVLGLAAPLSDYEIFCQENHLVLFEDCCESLGAFHQGRHVGLSGVAGSFSHFFRTILRPLKAAAL